MASGPDTRDVHLFNSIIGGVSTQLSPSALVEANPQWACAHASSKLSSANPSPELSPLRLEAPGRLLH